MRLLRTQIHPEATQRDGKSLCEREAVRGIVLREREILLLYTKRYEDYSLPGGGLDEGESREDGLFRELKEETGAQKLAKVMPFGGYVEFRPWGRQGFDFLRMTSYCYTCEIVGELAQPDLEDYEKNNGMSPVWIDIDIAIEHNKKTLSESSKAGFSIEREIFLLELIRSELL